MAVPKIGRITFGPEKSAKSDVLKIADDLAAKSRILRKAAQHDAVLDRLRAIGEEEAYAERARESASKEDQVASIQPLLRKGRELLREAMAAREEASEFLAPFEKVRWEDVLHRYPATHGGAAGSMETTRTRTAFIRALVVELGELLATTNGSELSVALRQAEALTETVSPAAGYAIRDLVRTTRGSVAETLRHKMHAIKKRLVELGEDIFSQEVK
jgi:hypothetical protein